MDGLALLCNLFADGPATLRSLRASGIRSLTDVRAAPEASLASILKTSRSHARRFLVEARELDVRLADMPLESELRPILGAEAPAERTAAPLEPLSFTGRRTPQAFDLQSLDADHDEPLREETSVVERRVPVVAEPTPERRGDASNAPDAAERLLCRHELPGLDTRTCEALVREGVRTYRALIELASLSLARRAGIPFTRLLDLRYAAEGLLACPDERGPTDASPAPTSVPNAGSEPIVVVVPQAPPLRAPVPERDEAVPFRFDARTPDAPIERDPVCEDPGVSGPFV